jgi:predicted permease
VLVVTELSLALTLLTGAGLLVKSFVRMSTTDLGIPTKNLLTLKIELPRTYSPAAGGAFFQQLLDRVGSLPGVQSVGLTNAVPLTVSYDRTPMTVQSGSETIGLNLFTGVHLVSPSLLQTLRIPLLQGRWLTDRDRDGAKMVAVINESAARQHWGGRNPIGDRVGLGIGAGPDGVAVEIVGVVGDVKYDSVETPVGADIYVSYLQSGYPGYYVVVRASQDPASLASAARREVAGLDRDLPIYDVRTMDQRLEEATSKTRFSAFLLGVLAALALTLSAVGVYGLMAYTAVRRTHEIGIRMALGAKASDVLAMMIREALYLTLIGLGIGLAVSFSLMHVLTGMLYGVQATDPTTLLSVSLSLVAVALLASYIPARRATRVDPMMALRHE